jgi:hypothetical protein
LAIVVVEEQANIDLEYQAQAPMLEENVEVNMDDNNVSDHEPIFIHQLQ